MSNHPNCYGEMFPDFTRLEKNKKCESQAFAALVVSHGIGVQGRSLEVKQEGWEKCVACEHYRPCYDLSMAKLFMKTLLANDWYGA